MKIRDDLDHACWPRFNWYLGVIACVSCHNLLMTLSPLTRSLKPDLPTNEASGLRETRILSKLPSYR